MKDCKQTHYLVNFDEASREFAYTYIPASVASKYAQDRRAIKVKSAKAIESFHRMGKSNIHSLSPSEAETLAKSLFPHLAQLDSTPYTSVLAGHSSFRDDPLLLPQAIYRAAYFIAESEMSSSKIGAPEMLPANPKCKVTLDPEYPKLVHQLTKLNLVAIDWKLCNLKPELTVTQAVAAVLSCQRSNRTGK